MMVVTGDKAAVGDSDAMGVATEIGEHLCWPAERGSERLVSNYLSFRVRRRSRMRLMAR